MHEFSALVAIGRANLALCHQCVGASLLTIERVHRLNVASLEAFWESMEAVFQLGSNAMEHRATGVDIVRQWERASEVFGTLSHGLSQFVADYAGDMGHGHLPLSPRIQAEAIGPSGEEVTR